MRWYEKGEFDKAREKFAAARDQFDSRDASKAAIAAFDQACAAHRKGDVAQARESYLKAGLAHDRGLAASAHFNLGTLAAKEASRLAGEHPENVAPEKRQEILDQLKSAVASFRHCVELQPDNSHARRDIELVRQWIKYYSDQWVRHDREKRRQETNLLTFLEFLIETQRVLRESVKALPATAPADAFAEPKRMQDELQEEIWAAQGKDQVRANAPATRERHCASSKLERAGAGDRALQSWADAAGEKMGSASRHLDCDRRLRDADQQAAIEELDKIWDAVIPFHPLLARDLADQTKIAQALTPATGADSKTGTGAPTSGKNAQERRPKPRQKFRARVPVPGRSLPKAKIWRHWRKCKSERCAGRNCSSSRPKPT